MRFMSNVNTVRQAHGFTLVEMLIIAPVVILAIGGFIAMMVSMTGEVIATRSQNVMAYDTQNALDQIEQDVKLSGAFLANNDFTLQSPQGYTDSSGTVSSFENANSDASRGTMLILRSFTTDKNPLDPARGIVYTNQPTASCDASVVTSNEPFTQNVVYFVKNNTLWRRTLIQQGASTPTLCSTPWQLPSCTPGVTRGSYCKVDDERLLDNVSSFTVQYFDSSSDTNPDTAASDSGSSDGARATALAGDTSVNVTLNSSQTTAGRTVTYSGSLRATKLNITAAPSSM